MKTGDIHILLFFYLPITLQSRVYKCVRLCRYLFSATFTVYRSHCLVLHCHFLRFNVPDEISDRYNITRAVIYGGWKSTGHESRGPAIEKGFFPQQDPRPVPQTYRQLQITIILCLATRRFFKKRSNSTFGRPDTFDSASPQRLWFSDRNYIIYILYVNIMIYNEDIGRLYMRRLPSA